MPGPGGVCVSQPGALVVSVLALVIVRLMNYIYYQGLGVHCLELIA